MKQQSPLGPEFTPLPPIVVPKEPVAGMPILVFSTDPSGWRTWLVLKVGRKWVSLFSATSLETWRMKLVDWYKLNRKCYEANKKTILRILRDNTAAFKLATLQFSELNAEEAARLVRGWKGKVPCST